MRSLAPVLLFTAALYAQDYKGPVPPKADVLYLLHASTLVETEVQTAHEESKKNETLYWVEGASSPARTPLAEPIFIVKADKLNPEKLDMFRFTPRKDRRELVIKDRPGKNDAAPAASFDHQGRPGYLQDRSVRGASQRGVLALARRQQPGLQFPGVLALPVD